MATQLAQRSSTLGSTAAAQKRAAAPRAPFSSPILAQLKQVLLHSQFSPFVHSGNPESHSTQFFLCTQNAKAMSAAQQPAAQRSVKAQVRHTTRSNAATDTSVAAAPAD